MQLQLETGGGWDARPSRAMGNVPQRASIGDIFLMGEHRLMCGDATAANNVDALFNKGAANMVLTDPPYGQNQKGVPGDAPDNLIHITDALHHLPVVDGVIAAFQSPRTFPAWLRRAEQEGYKFERMLWLYKKAQMSFPWRGWLLTSEAILIHSVGKPHWNDLRPYAHDTYELPYVSQEIPQAIGWHGSIKPLSVVEDIMTRCTFEGNIVYDPFAGSGTTLLAAERKQRVCYAMEICPAYCDIAIARWEIETGKKALTA